MADMLDLRRRVPQVLALLLAGIVALVPGAPAHAHAALVSSDPAEGARLDAPPPQIALTFSEDIRRPAYVVVTAPDGTTVDAGPAAPVDGTVTQPVATVPPTEASGLWTVAYRVVSVDGHPISAELTFTVREARSTGGDDGTTTGGGASGAGDGPSGDGGDAGGARGGASGGGGGGPDGAGTSSPTSGSDPAEVTPGEAPTSSAREPAVRPFWREHSGLLALGAFALVVGTLLLWWPSTRRTDD